MDDVRTTCFDDVGLVMPVYGQFDYANRSARSFLDAIPNSRVIWVDDCSPGSAESDWLSLWDRYGERFEVNRRDVNAGVTAAWEIGLRRCRELGLTYAICGNSDIYCPEGFWRPLRDALDDGWDLVGPATNAPGSQNPVRQHVKTYFKDYVDQTDSREYLDYVGRWLRSNLSFELIEECGINGFFMAAKTERWFRDLRQDGLVFNSHPRYAMTGSEDELEQVWRQNGARIGVVPRSFVFHYRSVTRGEKYRRGAGFRRS
jgi:hypothetical protein